jgi:methylated-DNA-[protein]-cysteine S-methyltransferase
VVSALAPATWTVVAAPFGAVRLEARAGRVSAIRLLESAAPRASDDPLLRRAAAQLERYFADATAPLDLPLEVGGTAFQRAVWAAIASIPAGEVRRYGELGAALDAPARAIGQACGENRLPLAIPCHRVVAADGLGGFAHARDGFALRVKRWLLEHEGALRGALL